jgi:Na+/proline symporter
MFGVNYFKVLDWIVVGITLGGSLLIGVYYAITSKHSNEDLLVGGRKMHILPVAASVMVTYVSAVTILGE